MEHHNILRTTRLVRTSDDRSKEGISDYSTDEVTDWSWSSLEQRRTLFVLGLPTTGPIISSSSLVDTQTIPIDTFTRTEVNLTTSRRRPPPDTLTITITTSVIGRVSRPSQGGQPT